MRFYLIDALRGIAALWVVLYHAYEGGHIDRLLSKIPDLLTIILFEKGHYGVPIFFVISGFVMAHSLNKDRVNLSYFGKFVIRRSIRLDPPYWGSIVLVLGLASISAMVTGENYSLPSVAQLVAHLFYAQAILGYEHINIIYWTLCLEVQFYLIYCLIVLARQRFNLSHAIVLGACAIISLIWPFQILPEPSIKGLFLPFWHAFLLGVFAYHTWKKNVSMIFLLGYYCLLLFASIYYYNEFSLFAIATAMTVSLAAYFGRIGSLNWWVLQRLGLISYSLYLTHNPITGASFFIFYKIFGRSEFSEALGLVFNLGVCIVFAYIFWFVLERWSLSLSKKISLHKS